MKSERTKEEHTADFLAMYFLSQRIAEGVKGFVEHTPSVLASGLAIGNAMRDAETTCKVGFGKTAESRAALTIQFRPLSEQIEFDPELYSLVRVVGDENKSCRSRGSAANQIQQMGWDLNAFAGHPFATHVLVNQTTGRDYFIKLESYNWGMQ